MVHPDWATRRRVLSLTLVGEWDAIWPVGSGLYPMIYRATSRKDR
jgi:hypothetical protein